MAPIANLAFIESATSLVETFERFVRETPDATAIRSFDTKEEITWRDYGRRVAEVAAGLAGLGVTAGDSVAIMLTNRPEFYLADMGAMWLGATPFSIYNTSPVDQIDYLLQASDAKVVVCEAQFLDRVEAVRDAGRELTIVTMDGAEGTISFADLEARGAANPVSRPAVSREDVATLIFTSGTTGPAKAVELTHGNLLWTCGFFHSGPNAYGAAAPDATMISYLPDAHLANRLFSYYLAVSTGATVVTVANPRQVSEVLLDARPTMFTGVPMIWYRVKQGIEQLLALPGEQGDAVRAAFEVALQRVALLGSGTPIPDDLAAQHAELDQKVLSPLRARLGFDRLEVGISGGAPISADALNYIQALGIPVVEGWAMSETSGGGILNPPDRIKPGTVGLPVADSEVRLAEDGELLVRSGGVMKGYRNRPDLTAQAIDEDGWLHTGDVATIDEDGYVTIVDRKKELIINSAGKNMSPANIENMLKVASPLMGSIVAIGDNRPYVGALVTLEPEAAAAFAQANGIEDTTPAHLATNPVVREAVAVAIDAANARLSRVEQVKRFTILPVTWLPDSDVLTPTGKLKRKIIADTYAAEIDDLYAREEARR